MRANGIRQHYLRYGARGPRLVIIPGVVSTATMWAHVAHWLANCSECYVLDVRGRGLSESGAHLDYGLDACAEDLRAFLATLELAPAIVLGHSMGARIAVKAAAKTPSAVGSLVLVDPPTSGPGRRPYPIPAERTLSLLRAAHRGEAMQALAAAPGRKWAAELQRLRAEWLCTCDERALLAAHADFHAQDFLAEFSAVNAPASLICAAEGGVVSEADLRELCNRRPDLQVVRVPGVGHQMQAEDAGAFRRALAAVLRHHDRAFERIAP